MYVLICSLLFLILVQLWFIGDRLKDLLRQLHLIREQLSQMPPACLTEVLFEGLPCREAREWLIGYGHSGTCRLHPGIVAPRGGPCQGTHARDLMGEEAAPAPSDSPPIVTRLPKPCGLV